MKKIFLAVVFMLGVAAASNAQVASLKDPTYNNALDTVVNAATATLNSGVIAGKLTALSVVVSATKISGTVGGVLSLEFSLDNSVWYPLSATTHTASDGSATYGWVISSPILAKYIRVKWVGTGTMSASFSAKVWGQ